MICAMILGTFTRRCYQKHAKQKKKKLLKNIFALISKMLGGNPCGLAPYDSPPRYAPNAFNKKRFAGNIPECPKQRKRKSPQKSPRKRISSSSGETTEEEFTDFPHKVIQRGIELGRGKESVVYRFGGKAVKVFDDNFSQRKVQENINFLTRNRKSGAVPKIYRSSAVDGWIEMEKLSDYTPLTNVAKNKSQDYRASLLDALVTARKKLPSDTEYKDMKKLDNIAVRHDSKGMVKDVKFYEGGVAVTYNDKLRGQQYVSDMAAILHAKRFCKGNKYCNIQT